MNVIVLLNSFLASIFFGTPRPKAGTVVTMELDMVIQGRHIGTSEIELIKQLMKDHPGWGRKRLSIELCHTWGWYRAGGGVKDMACRSLLTKLERAGRITLPPYLRANLSTNGGRNRSPVEVPHDTAEIRCQVQELMPVTVVPVACGSPDDGLLRCLLARYHYLGLRNTVGENMRYVARDRYGRVVSCLLFGSAAWQTAGRDQYIGWDRRLRAANLQRVTNNTRFLVPPWVHVPCLASHVLSLVARRVSTDWEVKYGHPLSLLETFVDRSRFVGTCYRAANWVHVGQTTGRSRNDRHWSLRVPVKEVYVYPLTRTFRQELCRC